MKKYDLIVIGGGSAGMNLLRPAAAKGWESALIEARHLGGTCINIGCIPSKTLIYSAGVMQEVRNAKRYGVLVDEPRADWTAMVRRKDRLVGRIRSRSYRYVEETAGIDLYEGEARFSGPHEITVNGEVLSAGKIIIAAGARTAIPPVKGLDSIDYLTSTSVMELEALPESLLILGGGIIALEFSQLLARLGVKATILQRGERLAPNLEPEISAEIKEILEKEGVEVKTGTSITSVGVEGDSIYAMDDKQGVPVRYNAKKFLVAAGRASNGDRLDLEKAGVAVDERGYITVDSTFRTSAEGIWAIGDITGGAMFTHRAWHDGMLLAKHLVEGEDINNRGRLIPFAVFTEPEIAGVGMGEKEASEKGYDVKAQKFYFAHHGRALAVDKLDGFIKLIVDRSNGQLLGGHIIGPSAGEIIHELAMAIRLGAAVSDLRDMMHIHPTLTEALNSAAWSG